MSLGHRQQMRALRYAMRMGIGAGECHEPCKTQVIIACETATSGKNVIGIHAIADPVAIQAEGPLRRIAPDKHSRIVFPEQRCPRRPGY